MTIVKRLGVALTGDTSRFPLFSPGVGISGVTHRWRADSLGADGSSVASWAPIAGSIALAQSTVAKRPVVSVQSGTKYVRFDGVDDILTGDSAFTEANLKTVVVVGKYVVDDLLGKGLIGLGGGSAQFRANATPKDVRAFWTGSTTNKDIRAQVELGTSLHLFAFVGDRLGGNYGVMVDGVTGTVSNAGAGTFGGNTGVEVGAYTASQFGNIDVAEVIAIDHAITSGERDAMRAALRSIYPTLS